ncbi:hypothetical protein BCR35DRAFT_328901 [Leucosporidium creatinivorum]|uniref:Uncharacterized protein n=1 Tax=Leucosporidium creatinivorum TaxID=106004 RepID=A0A1Y2G0X0_9BASI|nr:hypothetical protein BCR35DRAFT_328901 [Leucosporidium creatinivorum]
MASLTSEPPHSPPLEPSKEVSRAHLAAALLDYDAPEHSDGLFSSDSAAQRSAVLSPFRHLFVPPSDPADEPKAGSYFPTEDVDEAQLRPGTYSAGGRASPMFGGGSSERGSVDLLANRKSMGPSLMGWEDEEQDPEAEERLANEWGLGELMSQLGSGSVPTSPAGGVVPSLPFPKGMLGDEEAGTDAHETRSMPDLDRPRALSTISLLDPSASTAGDDPPLTRRIRILERRGSATRARTQSLGDALELPSFGDLPSFAEPSDISSRRPSLTLDPLISPNIATHRLSSFSTSPQHFSNRQSLFSLGDRTTAEEPNPRVSSSFARPRASTTASRPISRLSLAPSTTLDPPSRDEPTADNDADDTRPLSSLSMRPTTPATFTSRFDPAFLAAQRQEIEKERPVFANKDAGAPPAVVLMPAPLAGRPRSPPPRIRKEGSESEEEAEEEETLNDEEILASQRPAGALYGRSLMDVMAERQNLQKSRARHYVSGQDGRRSMMDWGDSPAGQKLLAAQGVAMEEGGGGGEGEPLASGAARRSKSAMSIFGPDLIYQRDIERLKVIEAEEAKEREAQEERERIVWEKEREKQEKKRSGKGKLLKAGRPSGEFPREGGSDAARSPPTSPQQSTSPPRRQGAGHSAMVPSISLPSGLTDPAEASSSSWFPVPASSKAPSSTSSDDDDDYRPPPVPSRIPLSASPLPLKKTAEQEKSAEHSERLRRAVMMGDMTPAEAVDESRLLGLDSGAESHSPTSDPRPLGERCSQATYASAGQAPPLLRLDLGFEDDEDGWQMTDRERGQIREVRGDRPPTPPSASAPLESSVGGAPANDSDEDDIPLAVRASMLPPFRGSSSQVGGGVPVFDEEDDVPLGVRASLLPPFQRDEEDEDDRPLGYAAIGNNSLYLQQQQQQQQQQLYFQQQQSQAAAFHQQQAFAMAMAQQQQFGQYAASEMGSIGGAGGMVEKWRRGVES